MPQIGRDTWCSTERETIIPELDPREICLASKKLGLLFVPVSAGLLTSRAPWVLRCVVVWSGWGLQVAVSLEGDSAGQLKNCKHWSYHTSTLPLEADQQALRQGASRGAISAHRSRTVAPWRLGLWGCVCVVFFTVMIGSLVEWVTNPDWVTKDETRRYEIFLAKYVE